MQVLSHTVQPGGVQVFVNGTPDEYEALKARGHKEALKVVRNSVPVNAASFCSDPYPIDATTGIAITDAAQIEAARQSNSLLYQIRAVLILLGV